MKEEKQKDCPVGKYRHPITKRCRNHDEVKGQKDTKISPRSGEASKRLAYSSSDRLKAVAYLLQAFPNIKVSLLYDNRDEYEYIIHRRARDTNDISIIAYNNTGVKLSKDVFTASSARQVTSGIKKYIPSAKNYVALTISVNKTPAYNLYTSNGTLLQMKISPSKQQSYSHTKKRGSVKKEATDKLDGILKKPQIYQEPSKAEKLAKKPSTKVTWVDVMGPNPNFDLPGAPLDFAVRKKK